jgi:hypothetical protein
MFGTDKDIESIGVDEEDWDIDEDIRLIVSIGIRF